MNVINLPRLAAEARAQSGWDQCVLRSLEITPRARQTGANGLNGRPLKAHPTFFRAKVC